MNKIVIGSDAGSYSVTNGTRNITISGLSYTLTTEQLAYVFNVTQDELLHAPAEGLNKATVSGGVITYDSGLPVLATGDVLHIQVWTPALGYDVATDSWVHTLLNPEYAHYTSPEHLIDLANTADATTSRYVIPFESYKNLSLHAKLVSGAATDTITVTFWATNNADADDTADTDWVDISNTLFAAASISANNSTTEGIYFLSDQMIALKYMVKVVVAAGGTPNNSTDVYIKKA